MTRYTSAEFDTFVRRLISTWKFALQLQDEWHTMDGEERAAQTEDWPLYNDIHQDLVDYASEHELTEDQRIQWAKLNKLVAEHTKDLEDMGYRVHIPKEPRRRQREVA